MTHRTVSAHFQCDCMVCLTSETRTELILDMEGKSWRWMYADARKQGWILSQNGKYCCAPGHEKDLGKVGKQTHKHH